jgi:hypothetical protein
VTPDPDGDEPFVLSTRTESRLVSETRLGRYALGVGLAIALVGLAAVATALVPGV